MEKFKKFLKLLNPQPVAGGLEISDSYLRFVLIKEKKVDFFSIKLPPGIVENGKIKNNDAFVAMLLSLHSKIVRRKKKKVYAVVSISDSNVYTSLLNLPSVASGHLEEAARLNLQMASPIDFDSVYADWQLVGEKELSGGNQLEIFGAFVPRQTIDEFESALDLAGFVISAIEFPAVSISRTLIKMGEGILREKIYMFLRVGGDGLTYGIVKSGNIYFVHFVAWSTAYGADKKINKSSLKNLLISETRKVLNFQENHIGGQIEKILLVSPIMLDEILKALSEEISAVKSEPLSLSQFKELSISWFSAVGLALRGLISRSEDNIITLASTDTDVKFKNYQIIGFIRIWRNISFAVLSVILLVFLSLNLFVRTNLQAVNNQLSALNLNPNAQAIGDFAHQAKEFNSKVDALYYARTNKSNWSSIFEHINNKLTQGIVLQRIFAPALNSPIIISGEAPSEEQILKFQDTLKNDPKFSEVQLPLSSIIPASGDRFSFNIILRINP